MPIKLDLEENITHFHSFKLSEIGTSIDYIPLESNKYSILSSITSADMNDSLILVNDPDKCLLFDIRGKFQREIGKKGNGPGEFLYPQQVRIIDNKIVIPNSYPAYFNMYNLNGYLLQKINSPGIIRCQNQISNYFIINDSTFMVQIPNRSGQEKFRISVINDKGEVLRNFVNTTFFNRKGDFSTTSDATAGFYQYGSKIRYKELLNDTIWQVEENELLPIYFVNRGQYGATTEFREISFKDLETKQKKQIWLYNIFETRRFIFIKTKFGSYYPFDFYKSIYMFFGQEVKNTYAIFGVYNRTKNMFFFITPTNKEDQPEPLGIENDLDGGINFVPNYLIGDSLMVGWFESSDLIRYINSKSFKQYKPKFPEKKKELEKLAACLNENDNPVLMLVKLKE